MTYNDDANPHGMWKQRKERTKMRGAIMTGRASKALAVACSIIAVALAVGMFGWTGYAFMMAFGDSMQPTLPFVNDMVVALGAEPAAGDIVTMEGAPRYVMDDGSSFTPLRCGDEMRIHHRLVWMNRTVMVTRGDANSRVEVWSREDYVEKAVLYLPGGSFVTLIIVAVMGAVIVLYDSFLRHSYATHRDGGI